MIDIVPPNRREVSIAVAGYLAASLLVFSTALPTFFTHEWTIGVNDGLDFRWKLWWVRHAVVERGQSPFQTELLWHPHGTPLYLDALTPVNGLQAAALAPVFGETAAFNLLIIEGFVLGGWFFFLFCRTYVGRFEPAFAGGILFAYCPYHISHLFGHLNFATIQFLPLFCWTIRRSLQTQRFGWAVASGVSLLLVAMSDLTYLAFALVLAAGLMATATPLGLSRPTAFRRHARNCVALTIAMAVAIGPLIVPAWFELMRFPYSQGHDPREFSADLLVYLVPGSTSLAAKITEPVWSRFCGNAAENGGALAIVCIVGCILGLRMPSRVSAAWIAACLGFALLSFGPELQIAGRRTGIVMPYAAIERLVPSISIAGTPVRLALPAFFCAIVAATVGFAAWFRRKPDMVDWRRLAPLLLAIGIECWPRELPRSRIEYTDAERTALATLRSEEGSFAILHAPTHDNLWHKHLQLQHRRPMVGGFVSRVRVRLALDIRRKELLPVLYGFHDPIAGYDYSAKLSELAPFEVRYIIAVTPAKRDFIRTLGLEEVFSGERFWIFRAPR